MLTTVYICVDDYYITPLVTHVNIDRCQKKKKWRPDVQLLEVTDTQTFYFSKTLQQGVAFTM